jgi:nucleolar protein 56
MTSLFLLHETTTGYALFAALPNEIPDIYADRSQQAIQEFARFSQIVKLVSFSAFRSTNIALSNITSICNSRISNELESLLKMTFPQSKKMKNDIKSFDLGIAEPQLGIEIKSKLGITCVCTETVKELLRGVRSHFIHFTKNLTSTDQNKVLIGLSQAFSRTKFNVRKMDNMIIQASALLETVDKVVNSFYMKIKEWYSWHFPELSNIIKENLQYVRIVLAIKDKSKATWANICFLTDILDNYDSRANHKAKMIIEAARSSMGQELCESDVINIEVFAKLVIELAEYKNKLHNYIETKMQTIAPNLSTLIGSLIGAKLVSHAGSLINLAKYSASTIQILGAEKALFRAKLKKQNTPKYGMIYNSVFVGSVRNRNKGRISRYVANKCAIAARVDAFMDGLTSNAFGIRLKEQVENKIRFYDEGVKDVKNITVMQEVLRSLENSYS